MTADSPSDVQTRNGRCAFASGQNIEGTTPSSRLPPIWSAACGACDMRPISILGIILIFFGVFVLASEGISYTKTEKILDVGPIEATATHRKTIPISPIAGGAAVAAGIVLVITGARSRSS